MICESMNITVPTAHAQSTIACIRLLRNIRNRVDRVAYGGGFEDFLAGIAMCMIETSSEQAFRRPGYRRQVIMRNTGSRSVEDVSRLRAAMARPGEELTFPRILVVGQWYTVSPLLAKQTRGFEFQMPPEGTVSMGLISAAEKYEKWQWGFSKLFSKKGSCDLNWFGVAVREGWPIKIHQALIRTPSQRGNGRDAINN